MSEPIRQQIKEAFKKTIERWEKIVVRPSYYYDSNCPLCGLFRPNDRNCNPNLCPIATYANNITCGNTPYRDFVHNKDSQNALAELNFLRKVYIWWMEEEDCKSTGVVRERKEEKKEEWVDVGSELTAEIYERIDGFAINLFHNDLNVAFIDGEGIYTRTESVAYGTYKAVITEEAFRILRKS